MTIAQEIANLGNYVVHFDGKYEDYWSPHLYRGARPPLRRAVHRGVRISRTNGPPGGPRPLATGARRADASGRQMDIEYRVIHPDGCCATCITWRRRRARCGRPPAAPGRHAARHHRSAPRRRRSAADAGPHRALRPHLDDGRDGGGHRARGQPTLTAIATYAQACQRLITQAEREQGRDRSRAQSHRRAGAARRGDPPPAHLRQESRGAASWWKRTGCSKTC